MSKQGDIPEYLEELIKWSRYTVKTKWNNIKTTQQNLKNPTQYSELSDLWSP